MFSRSLKIGVMQVARPMSIDSRPGELNIIIKTLGIAVDRLVADSDDSLYSLSVGYCSVRAPSLRGRLPDIHALSMGFRVPATMR